VVPEPEPEPLVPDPDPTPILPEPEPEPILPDPSPEVPPPASAAPSAAPSARKAAPPKKAARPIKAAKKAAKAAPPPQEWVEATGPTCPPTHPIKAKLSSRIFHLPGMLAYDRTTPDRCYRTAEAAVADGLRKAKR
jgi:hypothetical protein